MKSLILTIVIGITGSICAMHPIRPAVRPMSAEETDFQQQYYRLVCSPTQDTAGDFDYAFDLTQQELASIVTDPDQMAEDEAYAYQLQSSDVPESEEYPTGTNTDQMAQDEAYARQLQNSDVPEQVEYPTGTNADQDAQDEAYARQLQDEGNSGASRNEESAPASVECPICCERQTDMHAPCCAKKICTVCWEAWMERDPSRSCPMCRASVQR